MVPFVCLLQTSQRQQVQLARIRVIIPQTGRHTYARTLSAAAAAPQRFNGTRSVLDIFVVGGSSVAIYTDLCISSLT